MRTFLAAAVIAATTVLVPVASAAEPAHGEVSAADTTVAWTGEAYGQPLKLGEELQTHELCIAPFCDSFTLSVKDPGRLRVDMVAPGSAGYVDVLVTRPDGSTEFITGSETEVAHRIDIDDAATGDYLFDIWPNELYGVYDGRVRGSAELCPATQDPETCFVVPDEESEEES
jgi:hypothetical protein